MSANHLAENKLAGLIALELDVIISGQTLGVFIRDNWARIAPLAHLIHGRTDDTKPAPDQSYTPEHNPETAQSDHTYLRNLAEKLRRVPVTYGVDDGDWYRLFEIAEKVSAK
jgi:hypothetical protein